MNRFLKTTFVAALAAVMGSNALAQTPAKTDKPTIVLVHGAFADASSWSGVISRLTKHGYPVVAAANPLRGVKGDAAQVASIVDAIPGPVVLVGHSYGGTVISEKIGHGNVKALVYVAGFAPVEGETSLGLSNQFPGATLGAALAPPVKLADGGVDLYIEQSKFHAQFAADVPKAQASLMAATQRPIAQAALNEPSGEPAWRTLPNYAIYGTADYNIPPEAMAFMAQRSKSKHTIVIAGASHVLMMSHAAEVAALIEEAAKGP